MDHIKVEQDLIEFGKDIIENRYLALPHSEGLKLLEKDLFTWYAEEDKRLKECVLGSNVRRWVDVNPAPTKPPPLYFPFIDRDEKNGAMMGDLCKKFYLMIHELENFKPSTVETKFIKCSNDKFVMFPGNRGSLNFLTHFGCRYHYLPEPWKCLEKVILINVLV